MLAWLQNAVVALGARGIAAMRPPFRERVAQQMADNWIRHDTRFVQVVDANLREFWPALSAARRATLLQANALRTARAQLDHFWAWHARPQALREAVNVQGLELLAAGEPAVIAGAHQLGFEVALMRLSMETAGALIYDPGTMPLPRAAQRAWGRFKPQQVIAARGAARPALRALRNGLPLLVLVEQPADPGGALTAALLGGAMRFTPLVAWLARAQPTRVVWLDVEQHAAGQYSARLVETAAADMASGPGSARCMAGLLENALRADPAGYWWGRCRIGRLHVDGPRQSTAKPQDSGRPESSGVG